ncbi:MAG: multidrug efflux system outer membrane protein [Gammaproteobacteria bacterium]|jgi:multidrug efflux system outer membrane protein
MKQRILHPWLYQIKQWSILRSLFFGMIALGLSSCSLRPEFSRPNPPVAEQHLFLNSSELAGVDQGMSRWWERLEDPLLNNHIEALLSNNLSLKEATERVVQANERLTIQRGPLIPNIGANGAARRSFTPIDSGLAGTQRIYGTNLNAELSVSWQIDLFGRITQSVNAAEAGFIASQYDREAIQHSLIANLLNRRIAIAINAKLLALAKDVSRSQENLYALVKRRYDSGTRGTELTDVYLAEENLRSVQSNIPVFERQLAAETYRLDTLLGTAPGMTHSLESEFTILPPPRDVATCLPIHLLDRRPDLRSSEFRLAAADAEIGVAMADLYPGMNLGGTIGVSGNQTNNLLSADQLAGALLLSITSRLFEGGALRANIRLQESEARELSARYAGNVLEALREVETALKADQELDKELLLQQRSVELIRKTEAISESRYRNGIESLRAYLETQQRRYQIEQNWLRLQQEKWNNRIALYLALGGDWVDENDETSYVNSTTCS